MLSFGASIAKVGRDIYKVFTMCERKVNNLFYYFYSLFLAFLFYPRPVATGLKTILLTFSYVIKKLTIYPA